MSLQDKIPEVILAACILHNYILKNFNDYEYEDIENDNNQTENQEDGNEEDDDNCQGNDNGEIKRRYIASILTHFITQ